MAMHAMQDLVYRYRTNGPIQRLVKELLKAQINIRWFHTICCMNIGRLYLYIRPSRLFVS